MTQLNPNIDVFGIDGLPQYACPDLSNRGNSWVFPITDPCGSAQRNTRRMRKDIYNRFSNGVSAPDRCYIVDSNDGDDDDDDDSDSDIELKSTGTQLTALKYLK